MTAVSIREDGWAQRGGIDRVLTLQCGRTYTVDEKVRTENWPDILLEQWSDEERRIPGWIQKPLACDFIAYAYAPAETCYLLPVVRLQRAWRQRGREWIPTRRINSATGRPISACFKTETICSTENRCLFIDVPPSKKEMRPKN